MKVPVVPKPSAFNFNPSTMYDNSERLDLHLVTEKYNNSLRPNKTVIFKDFSKPHKDLDFFHPGQEVIRNDINKYKNIPHKDYIPVYLTPYYTIKETGFTNVSDTDIFHNE